MHETPSLTVTEQYLLVSFDDTTGNLTTERVAGGFATALLMDLEIDGQVQVEGTKLFMLPSCPAPRNKLLQKAWQLIIKAEQDVVEAFRTFKGAIAGLLSLAGALLVDKHILQKPAAGSTKYQLLQPALRTRLLQGLRTAILSGNITDLPMKFLAILVFTNQMLPLVIPNKTDQKSALIYLKTLAKKYIPSS